MRISELCDRLGFRIFCGGGEREATGCYIGDMLSRAMGSCGEGDIWITVQTSKNMVAVAELTGVAAVLLPEDIHISEQAIRWAQEEGITLAGCSQTAYEAACGIAKLLAE